MKPLNTAALLPHQPPAVEHLSQVIERRGAALDGSDTGIGKTFVGCGVAQKFDLPTLAVVPKIAISNWHDAAAHLGVEMDVLNWEMLRTGRTPFGWWDHPRVDKYKCAKCFEQVEVEDAGSGCRCNASGEHTLERIRKHNYGKFNWHNGIRFILFDEIHRGNARKSLNAELVVAARRQGIPALGLSATPAASPLHFRALGYLLGLHELTGDAGYYAWSRHLRCGRHPRFKQWAWLAPKAEQPQIMANLSREIFPGHGIRLRADDIPGFPERRIQANLFDLDGYKRIDELYEEMREALVRLKERKAADVDPKNPLTVELRCRQELELIKVPAVVELTQDYLAKGYAVAIFVNFSDTIAEVRARLKCNCYIDGTQTGKPAVRQAHIDKFQSNEERVIVVNNQAGGECCNLHDIRGEYPVVGLVMPPNSAGSFRQVAGRLRRAGGKSIALYRVIFAAKTKEVEIHRRLARALDNIDALMDNDLVPDNLRDII